MKGVRVHRRKVGPVIAWAPAHDAYHIVASMRPGASRIPPLHVTQRALIQLRSHFEQGPSELPFGLLSGALCVSPETKTEYLLVEEVTAARTELTPDEPVEQLRNELRALSSDAERRQKLALGWYIGGMDGDLQLDPEVAALHLELFPEIWRLVLVSGRESGVQQGAFLRYEPQSERFYAIPFSEALSESRWREDTGEQRTALQWPNYRSSAPVRPLEMSVVRDVSATTSPSRGRELDLAGLLGLRRRGADHLAKDQPVPTAKEPSPSRRAMPASIIPARRVDTARPTALPAQGSAVRQVETTEPAPEPVSPPAPPLPPKPAPTSPYLALAERQAAPAAPSPSADLSAPTPLAPTPLAPTPLAPTPLAPTPLAPTRGESPTVEAALTAPMAAAPALPEIEVPQVFIDGALVPLPDADAPLRPTKSATRWLPALLIMALLMLVALAIYLTFR
jgi:hypothetical protein